MPAKIVPWWRKILTGAMRGLRAGVAAFLRPGNAKSAEEPANTTETREEEALTQQPPNQAPQSEPIQAERVKSATPEVAIPVSSPEPEPVPEQDVDVPESPADLIAEAAAEIFPPEAEEAEPQVEDAIAEAATELVQPSTEPEAPEIEVVESAGEPAPVPAPAVPDAEEPIQVSSTETRATEPIAAEPEMQFESGQAEEPASPRESIEETVLAPEIETDAIAAEPDLDVALEAAAEEESMGASDDSSELDEPVAASVQGPPSHKSVIEAAAPTEIAPEPISEQTATETKQAKAAPAPAPQTANVPPSPTAPKPPTPAPVPQQAIKREEGPENSPFSVLVSQVYEGPMDLLLDLIRKQDIDIYDIPISRITAQFLAYVNHLRASDMDVAGEFIYTASLLIHIKSKMLLPREASGLDDMQEDPRRELVERLLEHERFKNAAQMLQQKQMLEAATWSNPGVREFVDDTGAEPEIAADTVDLVRIFRDILDRARNRPILNVEEDTVTVGQMIQFLSRRLTMEDKPIALRRLLSHTKSERALIAMFLALLELVRLQAILLRQDLHFSEIFIKKNSGFEAVLDQNLIRDDWQ